MILMKYFYYRKLSTRISGKAGTMTVRGWQGDGVSDTMTSVSLTPSPWHIRHINPTFQSCHYLLVTNWF